MDLEDLTSNAGLARSNNVANQFLDLSQTPAPETKPPIFSIFWWQNFFSPDPVSYFEETHLYYGTNGSLFSRVNAPRKEVYWTGVFRSHWFDPDRGDVTNAVGVTLLAIMVLYWFVQLAFSLPEIYITKMLVLPILIFNVACVFAAIYGVFKVDGRNKFFLKGALGCTVNQNGYDKQQRLLNRVFRALQIVSLILLLVLVVMNFLAYNLTSISWAGFLGVTFIGSSVFLQWNTKGEFEVNEGYKFLVFLTLPILLGGCIVFYYPPILLISWLVVQGFSIYFFDISKKWSYGGFGIELYILLGLALFLFLYIIVIGCFVLRMRQLYRGYYPGTPGIKNIDHGGLCNLFGRAEKFFRWTIFLHLVGILVFPLLTLNVDPIVAVFVLPSCFFNVIGAVSMIDRMQQKQQRLRTQPNVTAHEVSSEARQTSYALPITCLAIYWVALGIASLINALSSYRVDYGMAMIYNPASCVLFVVYWFLYKWLRKPGGLVFVACVSGLFMVGAMASMTMSFYNSMIYYILWIAIHFTSVLAALTLRKQARNQQVSSAPQAEESSLPAYSEATVDHLLAVNSSNASPNIEPALILDAESAPPPYEV